MARQPMRFAHEVLAVECVRVDDIAAILDVTPAYVRKCIACQTLPAVKVGRSLRIRSTEALRFLASFGIRATGATGATT